MQAFWVAARCRLTGVLHAGVMSALHAWPAEEVGLSGTRSCCVAGLADELAVLAKGGGGLAGMVVGRGGQRGEEQPPVPQCAACQRSGSSHRWQAGSMRRRQAGAEGVEQRRESAWQRQGRAGAYRRVRCSAAAWLCSLLLDPTAAAGQMLAGSDRVRSAAAMRPGACPPPRWSHATGPCRPAAAAVQQLSMEACVLCHAPPLGRAGASWQLASSDTATTVPPLWCTAQNACLHGLCVTATSQPVPHMACGVRALPAAAAPSSLA